MQVAGRDIGQLTDFEAITTDRAMVGDLHHEIAQRAASLLRG